MATASMEPRPEVAPMVRSLLGSLRGRIRLYVWLEGLTAGAAWLGVAFWVSLAVDWFFEPPVYVRAAVLAVALTVTVGVLVQLVGRRAFVRLSDANMATVLERRFPHLDDALLTAVLLADRRPPTAQCNPHMLRRTCRQAEERIREVGLGEVFNFGPLVRSVGAGVLFTGSLVAFWVLFPGASQVWARRMLFFEDVLWPRNTRLEVEGFHNGVRKVARGSDLEVIARADTRWPVVPEVVEIRYRMGDGARQRATMNRLGIARPGKDLFQEYSHTFPGVLAPIELDVVGGDDRVRGLRVEVVESPSAEMTLDCEYPPYMQRTPRTLPVTGIMQIPFGTQVTVRASASKDLVGVQVETAVGERLLPPESIEIGEAFPDPRRFQYSLASLSADTVLLFTLSDTDGIQSREPVRLSLVAVADGPPQLAVQLEGIGPAITRQARLPVAGHVTDDYGIDRIWFECVIDQSASKSRQIAAPAEAPTEFPLAPAALEAEDLELAAGQKLLLCVKAADRYNLGQDPERPNVGTSERWLLDVVSPEQLRNMLDARELVLRQRFEVIVQEVSETRDVLLGMVFESAPGGRGADEAADGPPGDREGAEPGDEPERELSPPRQLARRKLAVQRALQDSRKNAHETRGVAEAFDDIRLQLINNRIDTEELKRRLDQGIARPLHHLADEMFPELERRLERLEARVADAPLGLEHRDLARQQVDAILTQMRQVLERMIQLEDFNEAVELLRAIIEFQEQLHRQTEQRHKQKIRELLED